MSLRAQRRCWRDPDGARLSPSRGQICSGQALARPFPHGHTEPPKNSPGESRGREVGTGRNAGLRVSAVQARLERDLPITPDLALFIRRSRPAALFPAARGPGRLGSKFGLASGSPGWAQERSQSGCLTPPSPAQPRSDSSAPRPKCKGVVFPSSVSSPLPLPIPSFLPVILHPFPRRALGAWLPRPARSHGAAPGTLCPSRLDPEAAERGGRQPRAEARSAAAQERGTGHPSSRPCSGSSPLCGPAAAAGG